MSNIGTYIDSVAAVPSGVDGAVGVADAKWYVAIVNARHEKKVAERLIDLGLESFVATQKETRVWANGKRKTIDRVVIPAIVFIRCNEEKRRAIVRQPYIHRFMTDRTADCGTLNRPAATIPDRQIATLRFMLGHSDSPVGFMPETFRIKDNVRVVRGRLKGLEGQIINNPDGTHQLAVNLDLLGGATVKIDRSDIEKL